MELAIIEGVAMKGRWIKIQAQLQCKALQMLNMDAVPDNAIPKQSYTQWNPRQTMETKSTEIYTLNIKCFICIVHYHSKFPTVKRAEGLTAEQLLRCCKIVFAEYGLPPKISPDAGT